MYNKQYIHKKNERYCNDNEEGDKLEYNNIIKDKEITKNTNNNKLNYRDIN